MFTRALISVLFVLFGASSAMAGLYLEPYAGSVSGKLKYKVVASGQTIETEDTASATGYGARLGLSYLGLSFGVDYMGIGGDNSVANVGGFVGYSFLIPLRVSASYYMSTINNIVINSSGTDYKETSKGSAYRASIGYKILPFMAISADYIVHKWTDVSNLRGATSIDVSYDSTMLSLNFPLSL